MTTDSLDPFADTPTTLKKAAPPTSQPPPQRQHQPQKDAVQETVVMLGSPMAVVDDCSFSSGDHWSNWSNTLSAQPERLFYPNTLEDLQTIVREASDNKKKVRCVGSGHSWSSTAISQDYMVSVNNMNRIYAPVLGEDGTWTVMIESGVQVSDLDVFLRQHNPPLAFPSNVVPTDVGCLLVCLFVCLWFSFFFLSFFALSADRKNKRVGEHAKSVFRVLRAGETCTAKRP